MSNKQQASEVKGTPSSLSQLKSLEKLDDGMICELDAEGHCITCSDEALPVKVLRVNHDTGLAVVEVQNTTEEIDITLVEHAEPGDMLLAHGGVAIANLDEAYDE